MIKHVEFLGKEQIWQEETTKYWFDVNGTEFCIADNNGYISLLDSDGYHIHDCNDHDSIKESLVPHFQRITNECL